MRAFRVRKPGLSSTIQDMGRLYTRRFGLALSGAADKFALQVGNGLLRNPFDAAGIEVTLVGLELEVLTDCRIAVTGADLGFSINGRLVQPWVNCSVHQGDILGFSGGEKGCRAYLCVEGGIDVPSVFGSKSTDVVARIGGIAGRPLKSGDIIEASCNQQGNLRVSSRWVREDISGYISSSTPVRILSGPQAHYFSSEAWHTLLSSSYAVSVDSNRVGVRFQGPVLEHRDAATDILSEAVPEGAVQVPAAGQPIVLLADGRTVGGYPKIAIVITVDIPKLAQVRPGDNVQFELVAPAEAHRLLVQQASWWTVLRECW